MSSKSASQEHASSGLDRASFNVYDKADRHIISPLQNAPKSSDSDSDGDDIAEDQGEASTSPRSFANVRRVSAKARLKVKTKTHKILHTFHEEQDTRLPTAPALAPAAIHDGDDDRLFHPAPEHKGPQVKDLLHNPIDTVSSVLHGASGAKMAAVMDNQVIAHGADVNLVRVYDKVADADNKEEQQAALGELEDLKKTRQDQYVRWTMDRHVLKVRRVPPHNLQRPHKSDFTTGDQKRQGQVNWTMYSQHVRTLLSYLCPLSCSESRRVLRKGSYTESMSSLCATMPGITVTNISTIPQPYPRQVRKPSILVSKGSS